MEVLQINSGIFEGYKNIDLIRDFYRLDKYRMQNVN